MEKSKKYTITFLNGQEWEIPSLKVTKLFKGELFFFKNEKKNLLEKISISPFSGYIIEKKKKKK